MRILSVLLAPILLAQALWVGARALRLPEAEGARTGQTGQGAPLRVLIVGDSSAAGVGAATQSDALSGQLVAILAQDHSVSWRLIAKTGATSASTLKTLQEADLGTYDVVVLALGVNDVKNGVGLRAWRANYSAILDLLRLKCGVRHIYLSAVPPLGDFPLLPWPLNVVLGARASRFDAALQGLTSDHNARHLPFELGLDPPDMAEDGFHPGPDLYTLWAEAIYTQLSRDLPGRE
ncbi:MAG: SGNH/GDSL hydrolase family protein [Pelagimonas sp.]